MIERLFLIVLNFPEAVAVLACLFGIVGFGLGWIGCLVYWYRPTPR